MVFLSALKLADHLAATRRYQSSQGPVVEILGQETHASIAQQHVCPPDVEAEDLLEWTAVVDGPWTARRSARR